MLYGEEDRTTVLNKKYTLVQRRKLVAVGGALMCGPSFASAAPPFENTLQLWGWFDQYQGMNER